MRRIIGCFAISGCAGVCFTSAVVLAQQGAGGAAAPAPAAAQVKEAAAKKAVKVVGDENVPLNIQEGATLEEAVQAKVQRVQQVAAARRTWS